MSSSTTIRGSYPHPVLDGTDDVASSFEVFNFAFTPSVDDVKVNFQLRMTDANVMSLLKEGRARYSFRWKCGATLMSEEFTPTRVKDYADSAGYEAWIPQENIRRTVRVEIKIVATQAIPDYRLDAQHRDYAKATFSILPGDILGDGGYALFEPKKLYDPLNPPVGSCFSFVADSKLSKGVKVDFHHEEHVLVRFPTEVFDGLRRFGVRPELQIALVVLPALMETIAHIKHAVASDSEDDLSGKAWHETISGLVGDHGGFENSAFDLAQKILGNPVDRALESTLDQEDDDVD